MTIYSTIPDDQAIVLPKKGTNFKGRLVNTRLSRSLGTIVATSVGTASAPVTRSAVSRERPAPAAAKLRQRGRVEAGAAAPRRTKGQADLRSRQ